MKNTILILLIFFSKNLLFAQEYTSIEVSDISKEQAWTYVTTTFKELQLPKVYLNSKITSVLSDYYYYTSLLIKNKFQFWVEYQNDKLIIKIYNRQYLSNNQWIVNPLPMSKKQASSILDPIKEKIIAYSIDNSISETTETLANNAEKNLYTSIVYPDPSLGVAIVDPKVSTIDLDSYISQSGTIETKGKITYNIFMNGISLNLNKNIRVVNRGLLDKILGEINLGTSVLADPNMSLRGNRIILAGFYIISSYTKNKEKTTLNLRAIYTETGEIVYANTLVFNGPQSFNADDEAKKETKKINAALEKFAKERVLILKENSNRYH